MGLRFSKKCDMLIEIRLLIASEIIVIFTSSDSKMGFESIEVMKRFSLKPFIVNVDYEEKVGEMKAALFQLTGQYELPVIFIKQSYFGTFKELKKAAKNGRFQRILFKNKIIYEIVDYLGFDED